MRVMKGNISKKVMIAILSASMTMTPAVGAMMAPITVCAETIENNPSGQTINVDSGQEMNINYGTVENNAGEIADNRRTIFINDGSVVVNTGLVRDNSETGVINTNDGDVIINEGTVEISNSDSTVRTNTNGGEVKNNSGTVTNNYGTVTNSDSGVVVNNYGGTVTGGEVQNQFYLVNFVAPENGTVHYEDDFTYSNTNYYIKTIGETIDNEAPTQMGTITVTPSTNYEITGDEVQNQNGQDGGSSSTFTYSVAKDGTAYVITIASPTGNISSIGMDTFNLLIRAIVSDDPDDDNGSENTNTPTVILNDDGTATVVVENSNRNSSEQAIAPAYTVEQITEMKSRDIFRKLEDCHRANSSATLFEIDLGNDPCLNGSLVTALSFGSRYIACDFTHKGKSYILFVPPFDANSAEFRQCLTALSNERMGAAGPMRLAQLFAPCGFAVIDSSTSDKTIGDLIGAYEAKVAALTATSSVAEDVSAHNTAATAVQNGYQYGSLSGGTSPVMTGGDVTGVIVHGEIGGTVTIGAGGASTVGAVNDGAVTGEAVTGGAVYGGTGRTVTGETGGAVTGIVTGG